jgi:ribonuclease R
LEEMVETEEIVEALRKLKLPAVKPKRLARALGITSSEYPALQQSLRKLEEEGRLIRLSRNRYVLPEQESTVVGRIYFTDRSYAFVRLEGKKGDEPDIYISQGATADAMPGDTVLVRLKKSGARRRGATVSSRVIRILKRASCLYVGTLRRTGRGYLLQAKTCPRRKEGDVSLTLSVSQDEIHRAEDGDKVAAEIVRAPGISRPGEAKIVSVLGKAGELKTEEAALELELGLPQEFPEEAQDQAHSIPKRVQQEEIKKRIDLRGLFALTIDPPDARDFDDAISIEEVEIDNGSDRGYALHVHIADVSHYVGQDTPIDLEATRRGNSYYLPEKAIPMLPARLTEEIACLSERKTRLTVSVRMVFSKTGDLKETKIFRSVIRSRVRLTYDQVTEILSSPDFPAKISGNGDIVRMLLSAKELAIALRTKRLERGGLELAMPEVSYIFDSHGSIVDIMKKRKELSHIIIEEFMLKANEAVARFLCAHRVPLIFRRHDDPDAKEIDNLVNFVHTLDLPLRKRAVREDFQRLLLLVEGRPLEFPVNYALLRSMKKAQYSAEWGSHFALALDEYTHFTSPIRRYPDLVVQRILCSVLAGKEKSEVKRDWSGRLSELARHCSETEENAQKAEREFLKLRACLLMKGRIGEVFEATIISVTEFGFFVQLDSPPVEGLVHISTLSVRTRHRPERFAFDPSSLSLLTRIGAQVFRIGQRVRVALESVDIEKRYIDFVVV